MQLNVNKIYSKIKEKKLAWQEAMLKSLLSERRDHVKFEEILLNLPDITNDVFRLRIVRLTDNKWISSLADIPNPISDWLPSIAAAHFIKNPSKKTLAQQLRIISQNYTSLQSINRPYYAPWPMKACLDVSSNQNELYEMADRVEKGEFGDIEDWQAAEKRWQDYGIVAKDLDYMNNEHWPFDRNIAQIGFPFAISGFSVFSTHTRKIVLQKFLDIHEKLNESFFRSEVARWILFVLGTLLRGDFINIVKDLSIKDYKSFLFDIINDTTRFIQYPNSIGLENIIPLMLEDNIEDCIEFFDYFGKLEKIYALDDLEIDMENPLSELFCKYPDRIGILRILSVLADRGFSMPSIPNHLINLDRYDDQMFIESAIIVRLAQGNWSSDEAEILANHTIELIKKDQRFCDRVLNIMDKHDVVGFPANRYLLELHKHIPEADWKTTNRIIQLLNDRLGRRTSQLDDDQVWDDLRLSTELKKLL